MVIRPCCKGSTFVNTNLSKFEAKTFVIALYYKMPKFSHNPGDFRATAIP